MKKCFLFTGFLVVSVVFYPARAAEAPARKNVAREISSALADAVENVLPSVVVIRTEATRQYLDLYRWQAYEMDMPLGQGSGMIISKDGYVLTNNHVLQGAQRIEVVLQNEEIYPATFVGNNRQTDIAVLKIEARDGETFDPIEVADSDKIRVGEFCIAVGSPFSLQSTVTQGVISHKKRPAEILPIVDFIQTSAPINPGNSGGPLVDVDGRVIGINTFIQTASPGVGGNIGIGFAVPSNVALRVAELIIKGKDSKLAWVGIVMRDTPYGVYISRVVPKSPADLAGLQIRDMIVGIDNKQIRSSEALQTYLTLQQPGDEISVKIVRGQEQKTVPVTAGSLPDLRNLLR